LIAVVVLWGFGAKGLACVGLWAVWWLCMVGVAGWFALLFGGV